MKAILIDDDTPLNSRATVKVFKDGECIAIYEDKQIFDIVPAETVKEVVDTLDSYVWRRIRKMDDKDLEAKKILGLAMSDVQREFLKDE